MDEPGLLPGRSLTLTDGILQQPLATRGLEGLRTEKAPGQGGQGYPTAAILFHLEMGHLGKQPNLLLQQLHQCPVFLLQLHCGQGRGEHTGGPRGHPESQQGGAASPEAALGIIGQGCAEWQDFILIFGMCEKEKEKHFEAGK